MLPQKQVSLLTFDSRESQCRTATQSHNILCMAITCKLIVCVSESQHGRQTRIIQADFTEGHQIYPAIAEDLKDLEIGILGNLTTMFPSVQCIDIKNILHKVCLELVHLFCLYKKSYCHSPQSTHPFIPYILFTGLCLLNSHLLSFSEQCWHELQ